MIISQSITQLAMRSLTYLSLLILLPSFIGITSTGEYANIVLLSTLVTLAPLFDGGQAVSMTRWLAANSGNEISKHQRLSGIAYALRGSLTWTVPISAGFIAIWLMYSGNTAGWSQVLLLAGTCIVVTAFVTLANTSSRLMLTDNFSRATALTLISGPLLTTVILLILRLGHKKDFVLIAAAFAAGALLTNILFLLDPARTGNANRNTLKNWILTPHSDDDRKYRYGVFLSQIISILVVAKNPLLIRYICGDSALAQFSIFSAVSALIIAPAAAMQSPLMVSYSKMFGNGLNRQTSFIPIIAKHSAFAIGIGAIVAVGIAVLNHHAGEIFIKDASILTLENLTIILTGASIYIFSIVMGSFFTATGSTRIINTTAIIVLISDFILVILFAPQINGIAPFVTIAISNLIAICAWAPLLRSTVNTNERT